jgi:hypothetical protein
VVWNETFGKQKLVNPLFCIGKTQGFCQFSSPIVYCSGDMLFLPNVHSHDQGAIMDLIEFIHFEYVLRGKSGVSACT